MGHRHLVRCPTHLCSTKVKTTMKDKQKNEGLCLGYACSPDVLGSLQGEPGMRLFWHGHVITSPTCARLHCAAQHIAILLGEKPASPPAAPSSSLYCSSVSLPSHCGGFNYCLCTSGSVGMFSNVPFSCCFSLHAGGTEHNSARFPAGSDLYSSSSDPFPGPVGLWQCDRAAKHLRPLFPGLIIRGRP